MNNQKLLMFAVAGLLVPAADAAADIRAGRPVMVVPHPKADTAPTTGTPVRLKKTDSEQAGNEDSSFALFADGKTGLAFALTTELPGVNAGDAPRRANHRVQLSMVPFQLGLVNGAVEVQPDIAKSKFVTNNTGNEYRNAHASSAFAIDGGAAVCAQYNYQPAGQGDTKLYTQCFNAAGAVVMPQTETFAKNNDDCSMAETKSQLIDKVGATERYVRWHGCNGNGNDNAWVGVSSITKTATGYTIKRDMDLTVIANEERSRGNCYVVPGAAGEQPFAICAGTAGNTQPQRDGTYLIAVNLDPAIKGQNQQQALLWKKQIGGRTTVAGTTTYSMRAMLNPVLALGTDGLPKQTDMFFWRAGAVQGNNNEDRKGGQYVENMMGVVKVTRAGMTFVAQPSGQALTTLLGSDGTHNLLTSTLVGSGTDLKPALLVHNGSHTGGGSTSSIRALGWDATGSKFTQLASVAGPFADRHLYPNYLGNNPGNQGRGHTQAELVKNPFAGAGSTDQFVMIYASAGKGNDMAVQNPAIKPASWMSVVPVASTTAPATGGGTGTGTGGTGAGTGGGTGGGTSGATADEAVDGSDTTLGGCSTTGTGGLATFLLIGLAAFIRRRR
jgi:uncharacterized protein (TIGR03382 family)